jgi:DNA-binding MarR family transcriptional regulator
MSFKNTVGYLLHELAHLIDAESDQVLLERLGIGFAQFKVLIVLEEHDGATQKQIANALNQTEASISRQIKVLKNKALIDVSTSTSNRREHLVFLSERGHQMIDKATNALNAYHAPMFERLSEKQQLQIAETLQLIRNTINR